MRAGLNPVLGLLFAWTVSASAAELPDLAVPDGLGVNIHFTDPRPGEMEMLAEAGFRWVRMDFAWSGTEREKGQYDFSAYQRLLDALEPHGIRALFILDYSNPHYDGGLSPATDAGRKAFARWAAAAAVKFRGRGILWEMYNEPNIGFWKPKPDVEQYIPLAREVGRALREAAPEEAYIGPATSQIDLPFLEACFKAGLLEYWSAVSVHPYRQTGPETAAAEYAALRRLIDRYAPAGKTIPILSGEWGYSAAWNHYDPEIQGKMLPRQWLTNLACGVPVSIWYDWHDDGPDPKEPEHHFGTVLHPYRDGQKPVYEPKPAYRAARTLTAALAGFRYSKRLDVGSPDDHVLLFTRGDDVRLAAWTTGKPHSVTVPASPGRFQATAHTGEALPGLSADERGLAVALTDAPQYLAPEQSNALLRVAGAWETAPSHRAIPAQRGALQTLTLRNPLAQPLRVTMADEPEMEIAPGATASLARNFDLLRDDDAMPVRFEIRLGVVSDRAGERVEPLGTLTQTVLVSATNPLRVCAGPASGGRLIVRLENPAGDALQGTVRLTDCEGIEGTLSAPFAISRETPDVNVAIPCAVSDGPVRFGARIEDAQGQLLHVLPPVRMRLLDDFTRYTAESLPAAYQFVPDGDSKVGSEQSIDVAAVPAGSPLGGGTTLRLRYRMDEGWKFFRLVPRGEAMRAIEGSPKAIGFWLHGDGSGHSPRLRFVDTTGQTFQPTGEPITWTGWRYVTIPLSAEGAGHWGGANDGVIHGAIRWDSLLLIDGKRTASGPHDLLVGSPVLIE